MARKTTRKPTPKAARKTTTTARATERVPAADVALITDHRAFLTNISAPRGGLSLDFDQHALADVMVQGSIEKWEREQREAHAAIADLDATVRELGARIEEQVTRVKYPDFREKIAARKAADAALGVSVKAAYTLKLRLAARAVEVCATLSGVRDDDEDDAADRRSAVGTSTFYTSVPLDEATVALAVRIDEVLAHRSRYIKFAETLRGKLSEAGIAAHTRWCRSEIAKKAIAQSGEQGLVLLAELEAILAAKTDTASLRREFRLIAS